LTEQWGSILVVNRGRINNALELEGFVTVLGDRQVGLVTFSKLLGHSSIEMTMKYANLTPGHLRNAVNKLVDITSPNACDEGIEAVER